MPAYMAPTPQGTPVVLALGSARCWIGAAEGGVLAPVQLHPCKDGFDTVQPGALAAAIVGSLHVSSLAGRRVLITGARTRSQRLAAAHAVLVLLEGLSVRFLADADAARLATDVPRALVVDVGESISRVHVGEGDEPSAEAQGGVAAVRAGIADTVWATVARAMYCSGGSEAPVPVMQGNLVLLQGSERAARPERLFDAVDDGRNVGMAVLHALNDARVLQRAGAAHTIVVCGGGAAFAGFGARLLRELRERSDTDPRFAHLRRLVKVARVANTPFCPSMLPWVGGVIAARANLEVGVGVNVDAWVEKGAAALLDTDAVAVL